MYLVTGFIQSDYMYWQTVVQHYNFIKSGIDMSKVIICVEYEDKSDSKFASFCSESGATCLYFKKDYDRKYLVTCRPMLFYKMFSIMPFLEKEYIFYHDSDIIFRILPNFSQMMNNDKKEYFLADTISYIGYNYLKQKGNTILNDMCYTANIDRQIIIKNNSSSGGGQYFGCGTNASYWKEVAKDCESLYSLMTNTKEIYKTELVEYHKTHKPNSEGINNTNTVEGLNSFYEKNKIQMWTAGMWAELWNLWKRGFTTKVTEELDFSWATDSVNVYYKKPIMHNAGALKNSNLFVKGSYINSKVATIDLSKITVSSTSYIYALEVKKAITYWKAVRKISDDLIDI
jgi:hypothetical protein